MKKTLLLLTAAFFLRLGVPTSHAAGNVSVDFFYDQLGDYGDWVEVGDYGYGWQPRDVDADWRPYSDGRWAYTEAGWTWLSEEPYGWAVYHYGRWARIERKGWVWIPGTEWAPAWVSWRRSPRHVGWAPLPPEASFRRSVGFSAWVDSYYDIGPSAYRFVEVRNFGAPRLRTVFVEPRENITIIRQTTNITRITYVNSVVYNQGPRYEELSRVSAEPIRRLKLDRRADVQSDAGALRGEQLRNRVDGDSLRVFAPAFDARAAVAAPSKLSAKIENVEVNRGWKDAGPAADVEKLRVKVRAEAKAPKELPPQPKFEKFAEQTTAPEATPVKENPVTVAPGEKPPGKEKKDGGKTKELPGAPAPTPTDSKPAAVENPVVPEAPMKPQPPSKKGKPDKAAEPAAPGLPPKAPTRTEVKPEKVIPTEAEPPKPDRQGKARPQPKPVDPVEPKVKAQRPEAPRKLPPPPERPMPKEERSRPPAPAPRPEAPEPPKKEPKMPKAERPEAPRELPPPREKSRPKVDRPDAPAIAPGNASPPAPREEPQKEKPDKGKGKEDKKNEN